MAEYIEREALLAFLEENHTDRDWLVSQYNADWICSWIESHPAADVVEVKHGRWETVIEYDPLWGDIDYYKCSLCGNLELRDAQTPYCPHCGARMDGEGNA